MRAFVEQAWWWRGIDEVITGSGSDRVNGLANSTAACIENPVAIAPGTDRVIVVAWSQAKCRIGTQFRYDPFQVSLPLSAD